MANKGFWSKSEVDFKHTIQLDSVLDKIGHFGWFHGIQLILMMLTLLISATPAFFSYKYTGYVPKYRSVTETDIRQVWICGALRPHIRYHWVQVDPRIKPRWTDPEKSGSGSEKYGKIGKLWEGISPYINICWLEPRLARWNCKSYLFSEIPTQGGGSANNRTQFSALCAENKAIPCLAIAWTTILCCCSFTSFLWLWNNLMFIKNENKKTSDFFMWCSFPWFQDLVKYWRFFVVKCFQKSL